MKLKSHPVMVDEFGVGANVYLLTHYHSDHMKGLTKRWARGPLVCSPITKNLLTQLKGLTEADIFVINVGEEMAFDTPKGEVRVKALPANHCPGALMYLIEAGGKKYLHTGDFRLNDEIRQIADELDDIEGLYIDTTYAADHYSFPPIEDAIEEVLGIVERNMHKEVLIAVYTIGKNRIIEAVHKKFGVPVYMPEKMQKAYEAVGQGHIITSDPDATNIKAYSRGYLMKYYPMYGRHQPNRTVIIIPTGWAVDEQSEMRAMNYVYVPYSEHCDYEEYLEFIKITSPKRIMEI